MPRFHSDFDAYRPFADSLAADQSVADWGELPPAAEAMAAADPNLQMDTSSSTPAETPSPADSAHSVDGHDASAMNTEAATGVDPAEYEQTYGGGEVTRTEFGSVGGDGSSFYFFDSDSGASVMI